MKTKLIALILGFTSALAFGHAGVELGPNGGRILEFSKNETLHGEVTLKGNEFHIALLDKDKKPLSISGQTLTATSGDRKNPQKLTVEVKGDRFVVPKLAGDEFIIIFQFRSGEKAKPVTARLLYDAANCDGCNSPEWLCKCATEK